jgi:hypothetical protein
LTGKRDEVLSGVLVSGSEQLNPLRDLGVLCNLGGAFEFLGDNKS